MTVVTEPDQGHELKKVQANKVVFVNVRRNELPRATHALKMMQSEETSDYEEPVLIKRKIQSTDSVSPSH